MSIGNGKLLCSATTGKLLCNPDTGKLLYGIDACVACAERFAYLGFAPCDGDPGDPDSPLLCTYNVSWTGLIGSPYEAPYLWEYNSGIFTCRFYPTESRRKGHIQFDPFTSSPPGFWVIYTPHMLNPVLGFEQSIKHITTNANYCDPTGTYVFTPGASWGIPQITCVIS